MTRKDYDMFAATIADEYETARLLANSAESVERIARNIADRMAADNPRFDRARFLKACGVSA